MKVLSVKFCQFTKSYRPRKFPAVQYSSSVHSELRSLLDSLLQLQHSLLLRHRDTRGLVSQTHHPATDGRATDDGDTQLSDEEVPSDMSSNEVGSDREEVECTEVDEEKQMRRRKRKRKYPWVRCF